DALVKENLIDRTSVTYVARNDLVLIVPKDESYKWVQSAEDLKDKRIEKVALCDEAVPLGHYARSYLRHLWKDLSRLEGKIVKPDHSRAALTMVATGTAQAGFVYKTDADTQKDSVRVVVTESAPGGLTIRYPAGLVVVSKHSA